MMIKRSQSQGVIDLIKRDIEGNKGRIGNALMNHYHCYNTRKALSKGYCPISNDLMDDLVSCVQRHNELMKELKRAKA